LSFHPLETSAVRKFRTFFREEVDIHRKMYDESKESVVSFAGTEDATPTKVRSAADEASRAHATPSRFNANQKTVETTPMKS